MTLPEPAAQPAPVPDVHEKPALRVCYFGTYRQNYTRNRSMIAALRSAGVDVQECHTTLWHGIEDRVEIAGGGWFSPRFLLRVLKAYSHLFFAYRKTPEHDVVVLGYPGQLDVFLGRVLSWLRGKPLVLDVLMSLSLVATERMLDRRSRFSVRLLRSLERLALRLPDLLIQDTTAYVAWYGEQFGIPPERFRYVPIGANNRIFQSLPPRQPDGSLRALYYGTFIPNHHVSYIIEAARLLKGEPWFRLELIGEGPDHALASRLVQEYGLESQVTLTGWMSQEELVQRVSESDVCLGAFGFTPQSLMTVHNKIYEGMAMGRVVLTGDSPAIRAQFTPGVDVVTCDRNDPASLADALRRLQADPALCRRLAEQGLAAYQAGYTIERLGERFRGHLEALLGNGG